MTKRLRDQPHVPPGVAARVRHLLQTLGRTWGEPHLPTTELVINQRLTRTVARFVQSTNTIELAPAVLGMSQAGQREVLCHEAAHAVLANRAKREPMPHGREWRELMTAAGFEPRASLVRCVTVRLKDGARASYLHRCSVCHFSARAKRKMPSWRCPDCVNVGLPGILEVLRVVAPGRK